MSLKNNNQGLLIHLMQRAAFGIDAAAAKLLEKTDINAVVDQLFAKNTTYIPLTLKVIPDPKQDQRKQNKETITTLNTDWIKFMEMDGNMFREKVALFWHNHFACRHDKPAFVVSYINTIRKHALGNFGEMLSAITLEPAMLDFLNNRQNRKEHPNENFAREVMELFTIGKGNYSEQDIKEAARAFTGYGISPEGTFLFRPKLHDEGEKTFLGKTGNFKAEDILAMLLSKKETAQFVCRKIYRSFVNEKIDEAKVNELADIFFSSNYSIETVFRYLFKSSWFYETVHRSALIKSPVELIVGLNRKCGLKYEDSKSMILIQHMLGQILLYPPNVAGWPGGKNWIDSSRLMTRLRLASILLNSGEIEWNDEKDDAENTLPEKLRKQIQKKFTSIPNWEQFDLNFPGPNLMAHIDLLIGEMQSKTAREIIYTIRDKSKKDQAIILFSMPEFQLC